jgi:hypothetical protein
MARTAGHLHSVCTVAITTFIWENQVEEGLRMFRRENKVILQLNDAEYRLARECLMSLRNKLLAEGKCAEPVNELLVMLMTG